MGSGTAPTDRVRVRRHPERARYDLSGVHAILDAGFIGHLAVVTDGVPFAVPMLYARDGDELYLHGSPRSRVVQTAASGAPVSFTVTHLDGLVLARSAFHHSINYRSVVAVGTCRVVSGSEALQRASERLVEQVVAGRAEEVRAPDEAELAVTSILSLRLDEASAKVRTGPPVDAARDLDERVWAGVVPLVTVPGNPIGAPGVTADVPPSVRRLAGLDEEAVA